MVELPRTRATDTPDIKPNKTWRWEWIHGCVGVGAGSVTEDRKREGLPRKSSPERNVGVYRFLTQGTVHSLQLPVSVNEPHQR